MEHQMSCLNVIFVFAGDISQASEALRVALAQNAPISNSEPDGEESTASYSNLLSSFRCPMPTWGDERHLPSKIADANQKSQLEHTKSPKSLKPTPQHAPFVSGKPIQIYFTRLGLNAVVQANEKSHSYSRN